MSKGDEAPAPNDAYTGMLTISLLALIGGCVLLFLDYSQYPEKNPPALPARPPSQKMEFGGPAAPAAPVAAPEKKDDDKKGEEKKDDEKKADDKKGDDKKEPEKKP